MELEDQITNTIEIDLLGNVFDRNHLNIIERFRGVKSDYIIVRSSRFKQLVESVNPEEIILRGKTRSMRGIRTQTDNTRFLNEEVNEKPLFSQFYPLAKDIFDVISTLNTFHEASSPSTNSPLWSESDRSKWIQSPLSWILSSPLPQKNRKTVKRGLNQEAHLDSKPQESGGGPAISMILYLHKASYLEGIVKGLKTRLTFTAGDVVLFWGHRFVHWGVGYIKNNSRLFCYFDYENNGREAKDSYSNQLCQHINEDRADLNLKDSFQNGRRLVSKALMRNIINPARRTKREKLLEHCKYMRKKKSVMNKKIN